jgi:2-oxoglutarate dehydrogenase complex dehydrogenase (E1) component-like enzyme
MYDRFLADPDSVAESWREFFADYQRSTVPTVATSVAPVAAQAALA